MKFGLNQMLKEFNEFNLEGQDEKLKRKKEGCLDTIKNYISSLEAKEQSMRKEKMPLVKRQNEEIMHMPSQPKRRHIVEEENYLNFAKINASNLTLICKACSKSFKDLNTAIIHIYQDHKITQSISLIHCKYCQKHQLSQEKLKFHVNMEHMDKKGDKCEFCFKEYSTCGHGGLENYVVACKNLQVRISKTLP